jgi:arylsulfatase A-like enzyme
MDLRKTTGLHSKTIQADSSAIKPSRRQVLRAGVIAAGLVAVSQVRANFADPAPARRPNILLLVTDDQRADSLSCAGNPVLKTPNIDALAQRGVRFKNSFATTAICMSSRASILTGLYTRIHGIDDFKKSLAPELLANSYPMLLRKNGYRTGFIGKWGMDGGELPKNDYDYFAGYQGQGSYFSPDSDKHLTVRETEQAIEFLRGCNAAQPFCLAISFKAPHVQDEGRNLPGIYAKYPYDRALDHLYENDTIPAVKTSDAAPMPALFDKTLNRTREARDFVAATYQETMKDLYRLISGVDMAVGNLVDELKRLGFDDNTVIICTSDHGSFYGEHGFGGKWLMLEESIRTPLIICDPRAPASRHGKTCDQMVLNLDVPATVLDLAGIETPVGMQGKSVLALAAGETPPWRTEWFYEHHFRNRGSIAASEGIRTSEWKFIRYIDTDPVYEQLFNLTDDPREEKNLAGDPAYSDRLAAMRSRWKVWNKSLDGFSTAGKWIDPA